MPKDAQFAEFIKAFHLTFNPAGRSHRVKMIEPSDDYTQIVFSAAEKPTNPSPMRILLSSLCTLHVLRMRIVSSKKKDFNLRNHPKGKS